MNIGKSSLGQLAIRKSQLFLLLFISLGLGPVHSHESLYNYVEIRIDEKGKAAVEFSVHLPELAAEFGVDPLAPDLDWLSELTSKQRSSLVESARIFVAESYQLVARRHALVSVETILFPELTTDYFSKSEEAGARPGCLVGTLILEESLESLTLTYRETGKRLMVVISQPGSFPKVHDLGPDESASFSIPLL